MSRTKENDNNETSTASVQRLVSRRFRCRVCGGKGRHSKTSRGSDPICGACKNAAWVYRSEYID